MIITDLTWLKKFVNISSFQIYKIIERFAWSRSALRVRYSKKVNFQNSWFIFYRMTSWYTPNLSLKSNKSIFYDKKSSSTVKESVVLTFFYVGQVTKHVERWHIEKHGPGSMNHLMDPVHGPPHAGPWTAPNFQKEIAPVNMKVYRRSGYETHRLVFFHQYTLITNLCS